MDDIVRMAPVMLYYGLQILPLPNCCGTGTCEEYRLHGVSGYNGWKVEEWTRAKSRRSWDRPDPKQEPEGPTVNVSDLCREVCMEASMSLKVSEYPHCDAALRSQRAVLSFHVRGHRLGKVEG